MSPVDGPLAPRTAASRWISVVFAFLSVPAVSLGIFDPIEGGMALVASLVPVSIARFVSGIRLPRILWIPLVTSFVTGIATIVLAVQAMPDSMTAAVTTALWMYEASVVVTIVGSVRYAVMVWRGTRDWSSAPQG